jgi:hypothetical protein
MIILRESGTQRRTIPQPLAPSPQPLSFPKEIL